MTAIIALEHMQLNTNYYNINDFFGNINFFYNISRKSISKCFFSFLQCCIFINIHWLRLYELFVGPPELDSEWDDRGIDGVYRFLNRFWKMVLDALEKNPLFHSRFFIAWPSNRKNIFSLMSKTFPKLCCYMWCKW